MKLNGSLLREIYSTPLYAIKTSGRSPVPELVFNDSPETVPLSLFIFNAEKASAEENLNHEKIASIARLALLKQAMRLNLDNGNLSGNFIFNLNIPTIISLGCSPQQLGLQIEVPLNRVVRFREIDFIFTHSILQMENDSKLKMAFWKNAYTAYYQIKTEKK